MSHSLTLGFSCPDQSGIVHAVSSFIVTVGGNITESQQYEDKDTQLFFMRVAFDVAPTTTLETVRSAFSAIAQRFEMRWKLVDTARKERVMLMVSEYGHCLNDLLFRHRSGALDIEIPLIVSNHKTLEEMAQWYGIPFVHVPVTPSSKADSEARLSSLMSENEIDLVVLARYMQILSDEFCTAHSGNIINIHHSFLPSFKGAKPYHQAHDRGVKLIGATAHYVTSDLDEGPIIEQEIARVDHAHTPEQLAAVGRDVEAQALARAVRWHSEHRVFLSGRRTIVFK
jgi:formyltetrahydrofolate deformylase